MTDATAFAQLIPGFDFLQNLMKSAGGAAATPTMGQWIAPTLDPDELDKRINELKTVKFWLEQNSRMLDATIQALEVQRMTLSTLKTMNLRVADLQQAMTLKVPQPFASDSTPAPAPAPAPTPTPAPSTAPEPEPEPPKATKARTPRAAAAPASGAPGAVDPMQWWNALTQQFGELASNALKDGGAGLARNIGAMAAAPMGRVKAAATPAAKASSRPAGKAPAQATHNATRKATPKATHKATRQAARKAAPPAKR